MTEDLTGYEASELAAVEELLDDNPVSAQGLYYDTMLFDPRAIAVAAAKRASEGSDAAPSMLGGIQWYANTLSNADSDPGAGTFKTNLGQASTTTEMYVDNTDGFAFADMTGWLTGLAGSRLMIQANSHPDRFFVYDVSAVEQKSGYVKLTVDFVCGSNDGAAGLDQDESYAFTIAGTAA